MIKGGFVALPTPFTSTSEVDLEAFAGLVRWHLQEGSDGILVCGTTGEAATLSQEEKKILLKQAVSIAKDKLIIMAGTGSNDTCKAVLLTQQAKANGADACLVIFPYYNKPTFAGCLAHFREIAKVGLPIVIYHHPPRTGLRFSAAQLAEICEIKEVIGVKDSSGDIEMLAELVQLTSKPVLTGDDTYALALLAAGGKGVCSTVGNLIPRAWKRMIDQMLAGDLLPAQAAYQRYFALCKAIFIETNPLGVKYALSLMGKCNPYLRLPLVEPQESTKRQIREALEKVQLLDALGAELTSAKG